MNFLLTRWPIYIIFILFVIFNISIEYNDLNESNSTIRNIQLGLNGVMIVLIIGYIFSTVFYSKLKKSIGNFDYYAASNRTPGPIMNYLNNTSNQMSS